MVSPRNVGPEGGDLNSREPVSVAPDASEVA